MLADRADKIWRKDLPLIDISADSADPAHLLLFYRLWLRLDVGKVILIRHRWNIRKNPALRDLCDEDGMCLKFDFLNDLRGNQCIRSSCHIGQPIR